MCLEEANSTIESSSNKRSSTSENFEMPAKNKQVYKVPPPFSVQVAFLPKKQCLAVCWQKPKGQVSSFKLFVKLQNNDNTKSCRKLIYAGKDTLFTYPGRLLKKFYRRESFDFELVSCFKEDESKPVKFCWPEKNLYVRLQDEESSATEEAYSTIESSSNKGRSSTSEVPLPKDKSLSENRGFMNSVLQYFCFDYACDYY